MQIRLNSLFNHLLCLLTQCTRTGKQQETMAKEAGFSEATHYEIGFGLMGVLVASKSE